MRSSLLACLLVLAGCDALTPPICVRNSDCPTSQICDPAGLCALAPEAGPGDAADDSGAGAIDASVDAAAAQAWRP